MSGDDFESNIIKLRKGLREYFTRVNSDTSKRSEKYIREKAKALGLDSDYLISVWHSFNNGNDLGFVPAIKERICSKCGLIITNGNANKCPGCGADRDFFEHVFEDVYCSETGEKVENFFSSTKDNKYNNQRVKKWHGDALNWRHPGAELHEVTNFSDHLNETKYLTHLEKKHQKIIMTRISIAFDGMPPQKKGGLIRRFKNGTISTDEFYREMGFTPEEIEIIELNSSREEEGCDD